jgi:hypothetical protein
MEVLIILVKSLSFPYVSWKRNFWFLVLWLMVYFNAGVFQSLIQDHLVGC